MYFLYRAAGNKGQNELWSFIAKGALRLDFPVADEWLRIHGLMQRYADMPLDLADASLVVAAQRLNDYRLFSIDNALRAIQINGRRFFDLVP